MATDDIKKDFDDLSESAKNILRHAGEYLVAQQKKLMFGEESKPTPMEIKGEFLIMQPAGMIGTYDISLTGIKDHIDILKWVLQLTDKNWCSTADIQNFILLVSQHNHISV